MRLILSAGMPRSGSTLLFNILRILLFEEHKDGLVSGWNVALAAYQRKTILLKTHSMKPEYIVRAEAIFYSYRDLRTAAASHYVMFGVLPTLIELENWILEYEKAKAFASGMFEYHGLINNTSHVAEMIATLLRVKYLPDIEERLRKLTAPEEGPYSPETLLHPNHRRDIGDEDWKRILPIEFQQQLHQHFWHWLKETGMEK